MNELSHVFLLGPGIVIGLIVAAPIGPVNLICIRRTLQYGFLNGFLSGLGAALGDGLFAIVTGFGLTAISQWIEGLSTALQLAGGTLLLCFGLYTYFSKPPARIDPKSEDGEKSASTLVRAIVSTFALTITNPANAWEMCRIEIAGPSPLMNQSDTNADAVPPTISRPRVRPSPSRGPGRA